MKSAAFPKAEYDGRLEALQAALVAAGHTALLVLRPESITYLTGFYTRAYATPQAALILPGVPPVLFCREAEAWHLARTAVYPDHIFWHDGEDPLAVLAGLIAARVPQGSRVAVEAEAWTLPAARFDRLRAALPGIEWADASELVAAARRRKSAGELDYHRKAARAAEAGMRAGIAAAAPGATERDVAAAIACAMILAGSDTPGPGVLSSGEAALHLHGSYGDRVLRRGDTLQIEPTPQVGGYHARFMRPIKVGSATAEDVRLAQTLFDIQDRALASVAPGVPASVPDTIYREGVVAAGLAPRYTYKTFYNLGLLFPPVTGELPEAAPGCSWRFEPGMVFHTYLLVRGFGVSETIVITDHGVECLTRFPRRLHVGGEAS